MSKEIDPKLLEILVCPLTKETLSWDKEKNELVSKKAGLAYQVKDGIPIMLPDEARKLDSMIFDPGFNPFNKLGLAKAPPEASFSKNNLSGL